MIWEHNSLAFSSSKRLCCWAGLTPGSNESAGKKKSVRITRAGVYLKPALVQCAHAAVKSDKSPYYKKKYESLVKRRGKKRAIIAIARMILTAIYQMKSKSAFIRHMILYGYVYDVNYEHLREYNTLLARIGNNLNQIAKRMNATGNVYEADVKEVKELMKQIWQSQKSMLSKQPSIKQ